ncbi:MAG: 2-oxoacid:acceptor oxidoreductase family protein [Desulfuromonadales bacterium]|jgi:pyruvate ferredoxin oxidoreductase gamma subunit
MYRIRFHGRGGQGMKTASRILGTAFFKEGYEVQDAPRYGAERRGAPIFAYVRAAKRTIFERGVIRDPNLVVVADETLVPMPAAGVLQGLQSDTVLVLHSRTSVNQWQDRLKLNTPIHTLAVVDQAEQPLAWHFLGVVCAAAAARLIGNIQWDSFASALREEIGEVAKSVIEANLFYALRAYEQMAEAEACVVPAAELAAGSLPLPGWIELPFEDARLSAPTIHEGLTSEQIKTGLWRTLRPVIDETRCKHCVWICSTYCPDGAIRVEKSGRPQIDYQHCKGCMVCVAQCPNHAIEARPEHGGKV